MCTVNFDYVRISPLSQQPFNLLGQYRSNYRNVETVQHTWLSGAHARGEQYSNEIAT